MAAWNGTVWKTLGVTRLRGGEGHYAVTAGNSIYLTSYGTWEQFFHPQDSERVARYDEEQAYAVIIGYEQAIVDAVRQLGGIPQQPAIKGLICTSDDPTDHQGETCPIHES